MIINNTSIRGLFLYDPSSIYEQGDFIVYKNTIYIVKSEIIQDEIPKGSKNYFVYLGDQMTSIEDYLSFLNNGGGEDKYISLGTLLPILNHYMIGLDGKGIIGSSISYTSEDSYEIKIPGYDDLSNFSDYTSVLGNLLLDPSINHGIFRVSRLLPEIRNYVLSPKDTPSYGGEQIDLESCILKQYSYYNNTGILIRVQELIDHVDGMIFYRYGSITSETESIILSEFKAASINTKSLRDKANMLMNVYTSKIKALDTLSNRLQNNFRYKNLKLKGKQVTLQNTDPSLEGYLSIDNLLNIGPITLHLLSQNSNSLYISKETCVDLSSYDGQVFSYDYYISEEDTLRVMVTSNNSSWSIVFLVISNIPSSTTEINSIYIREYYKV